MARTTYMTFLMHGTGTGTGTVTYEKLVDIKSYPDMGSAPEPLECTTMSDGQQRFKKGIITVDGNLEFEANFDKADYIALEALAGQIEKYALWFGGTETNGVATPTGDDGKLSFEGDLSVRIEGGGVNEIGNMIVSITPYSRFVFE